MMLSVWRSKPMMILFYALQPILCPPCPSSHQSSLWWSPHIGPSHRVTLKSAKMSSTISDRSNDDDVACWPRHGMSGAIDQSGNYINRRLLLLFPPWELMPGWKNWQKYTSAPLLWTEYQSNTLSSFRKKATKGGQVDSIYYTSTWHSLMESFWWGRPNIWLGGKGEYLGRIGHGKYFLSGRYFDKYW